MTDELLIDTKINIINSHITTVNEYIYNYDLELKIIDSFPQDQQNQDQIDQFNKFKADALIRLAALKKELALLTQSQ
jgi:hypothetical protein